MKIYKAGGQSSLSSQTLGEIRGPSLKIRSLFEYGVNENWSMSFNGGMSLPTEIGQDFPKQLINLEGLRFWLPDLRRCLAV